MKRLYLIGGTMGIGKTTTCQVLKKKLDKAVFLDGDWCWDADPFQVNEETKEMVVSNICFVLNNFIHCSAFHNIIFCWVMHEQTIIDTILSRIDTAACEVKTVSLICSPESLKRRLQKDVDSGIRNQEIIDKSTARISMYEKLNTIKIDVSDLTAEETAKQISEL